ncbi:hypothetical protein [Mangrovibacter phragmitis]|uniref:hypothetical protein n=1 Tax=Mangrovibacter phragmitis TaxID=1691903 RepID=UPI003862132A
MMTDTNTLLHNCLKMADNLRRISRVAGCTEAGETILPWHAVAEVASHIESLCQVCKKQGEELARYDRSETQLIEERDHAETALSDMYEAATGERPEWSNVFSFSDAVNDVAEHRHQAEAEPHGE